MADKIRFTSASTHGLVLAKVGHPQRDEPLVTSKEVFEVGEDDQETLTAIFLKPFKNLTAYRFSHHSSLGQNEMNACVAAIFESEDRLLEKGREIAKRLYTKSNHPNIKSGDLCISLIRDIDVNGELTRAICILKSESVVPFLSISTRDGDLTLHTEQGINPEKIDKGCLILNHMAAKGHHVFTFDRSGTDSRFWVRDFLGISPVSDSPFLTNQYANLAVAFLDKEDKAKKNTDGVDSPPWETSNSARAAISYFEEKENFSLQEFEDSVLKTPELKSRFAQHRADLEADHGKQLGDSFSISKKDVSKAKRKLKSVMKFDTGAEVRLSPALTEKPGSVLEHGYDDQREMRYIKIYFNEDLAE